LRIINHGPEELFALLQARFEHTVDVTVISSTDFEPNTAGACVHVALDESDFPTDRSSLSLPQHQFVLLSPTENEAAHFDCRFVSQTEQDGLQQLLGLNRAMSPESIDYALLFERFDEFVSVAHHDLSETHRTIAFFSDYIRQSGESLDENLKESLERVHVAGQRSQLLLRDLSRYARVWLRNYQPADLDEGDVQATAEMAFERAKERTGRVNIPLGFGALCGLRCSERFLGAIFEEILANALEHHASETAPIQINTQINPEHQVAIFVTDSGPGIRDPGSGRLFRPFYRGKRDDELRSGIGLALVRAMAEKAGGSVCLTPAQTEDRWCLVVNLPQKTSPSSV